MIRQLTLDLSPAPSRSAGDFQTGPANALAVAALDSPGTWPGLKAVLSGPAASGKSHLVSLWAARYSAPILTGEDLAHIDLPVLLRTPLVVEDADRIAGHLAAERALFHLHNMMAEARQPLLITARRPPRDWGLALPDLASRLFATAHFRIDDPDDALLRAVMAKQFADRQLRVDPELIDWLALRMTRSWEAARLAVSELDQRALQNGTPISKQLAQDWLDGDSLFPDFY